MMVRVFLPLGTSPFHLQCTDLRHRSRKDLVYTFLSSLVRQQQHPDAVVLSQRTLKQRSPGVSHGGGSITRCVAGVIGQWAVGQSAGNNFTH
jgi:hypothetical protein